MTSPRLPRSSSGAPRAPAASFKVPSTGGNKARSLAQSQFIFGGGLMGKNQMPLTPAADMQANTFDLGFIGV
jgi:hypothetical protein